MARDTKERSVRRDPSLREGRRDVVLQESRRFFSARGGDQAERQARALTGALGIGVEAYVGVLERRNVKGSARAVQEAAVGGDRDETDANKGYNDTFDEVEAANDLSRFASELPEILIQQGWTDLSEAEAQEKIDGYYAGQLAGINPDSIYGKRVAVGILKQNEQLLQQHRTVQAEKAQQERRIMVRDEAVADYGVDGVLDHDKLMDRVKVLMPGPGGRLTYVEIVIDTAIEAGDLTPIETIPDFFPNGEPTGMTDPNFVRDVIAPGLAKAQAQKTRNEKEAEAKFLAEYQGDRALAHSKLTTRAKAGDGSVLHDIDAGGEDGPETETFPDGTPRLLTRPHQKTLYDQLSAAQIGIAIDANLGDLFGEGRAFGLTETQYDQAASVYAGRQTEKYGREQPEWDKDRVQAEVLKDVIERSVRHDLLPKFLKDFIDVSPNSPERFAQAVNVKRMIDVYDPTLVQRRITDRNAAFMDVYELQLRETGSEETALEALKQYDPTIAEGRGKEVAEIADGALSTLAGDSGFWPLDYAITHRDRARASTLAKHYINLHYTDDQAEKFVVNGMRARNTRVNGVMYPIDDGWRKGDEAADWFLGTMAPEFFGDKENMVLIPHPFEKGFVVIRDSAAQLPYASPKFSIKQIEDDYQIASDDLFERTSTAAEQAAAPEKEAEAERRAFADMFPLSELVFLKPGPRAQAIRRNQLAWKNLPVDDRRRLINAQKKDAPQPVSQDRTYTDADFDEDGNFIRDDRFMAGTNAINAQAQ